MGIVIAINIIFMIFFFAVAYLAIKYFLNQIEKYPRITLEDIYNSKKDRQKYNIEDKEYIRTELQNLIELNTTVLEQLADQLKLGSVPRLYEVYSTLSNSISENLMDLAKLDQVVTNYRVTETAESQKDKLIDSKMKLIKAAGQQTGNTLIQQNNYAFNSKDLLNMLKGLNIEHKKDSVESLPKFNLE